MKFTSTFIVRVLSSNAVLSEKPTLLLCLTALYTNTKNSLRTDWSQEGTSSVSSDDLCALHCGGSLAAGSAYLTLHADCQVLSDCLNKMLVTVR